MPPLHVLVLGAGFGGLEVATTLTELLPGDVSVTVIDRSPGFVFGFAKLDVMFGRTTAEAVLHPYRQIQRPDISFVSATITAIDPERRQVITDAGAFTGDVLVVALGADLDPAATPGLVEAGHEFYTNAGAFALRETLQNFDGGRVVVGVTSVPFKCPPAPSETALLMDQLLVSRGLRDRSHIQLVMPLPVPIPPSPEASEMLLRTFAERGIEWVPNTEVFELDPARRVAIGTDGRELAFDLFLGVPKHRAPRVVVEAGLTDDGWIPVDSLTLQTRFPAVYAVGDVASVGTPKAGVFAEGQATVVAQRIAASYRGDEPTAHYDGNGRCYLEFGRHEVATVDVTFRQGEPPTGTMEGPSAEMVQRKIKFGTTRVARWFGPAATASR